MLPLFRHLRLLRSVVLLLVGLFGLWDHFFGKERRFRSRVLLMALVGMVLLRMNTEQIRQNLESETERLSAIRTDLRESHSLDSEGNDQEISNVDQHPADSGTEQAQREIDFSLLEQVESELSDVERAMKKLDEGTYGQCEVDSEPIELARLEALPATRFCEKHA